MHHEVHKKRVNYKINPCHLIKQRLSWMKFPQHLSLRKSITQLIKHPNLSSKRVTKVSYTC